MSEFSWLPENFRAIRPLGKGGMGEVWLVEDIKSAGLLACKFLRLDHPDEAREPLRLRFKREYLVLAKLAHPGLARAHELFEAPGTIAYTMDYVEGWPLKEYFLAGHWCAARGSERNPDGAAHDHFSPTPQFFTARAGMDRVLATGVELLGMLAWLHGSGIIHRDLKPANLMVEKSGKLRMIDFGLARGEHEVIEVTQVGEIIGTPSYIAPEQIRGQRLDGRSDLYAVGVILYELLTGSLPFSGPPARVLMAHLGQAPRSPRELNPLITGPLSGYILRLLAKTPQARFATAEEARHGLQLAAGHSGNFDVTLTLQASGSQAGRGLLLTTPYEGNHDAVDAMTDLCKNLHEQGRGSLTLISGSAGGGKSRLLDELRGAAVERGVKVLRGGCHEGGAGQLFNGIFQTLAEEMARHPARAAQWLAGDGELLAHHYPALRRLPGLRQPGPSGLDPASAKAQLMGAVYGFFARLAREERVIIAAEDLHWADAMTLELLAHLTRSFALAEESESPLAVVINFRQEEVVAGSGLEKWLAAWNGDRVARLRLKPLGQESVARLIQEALGAAEPPVEATVSAFCDLTGGNPFFVLELLRRAREEEAKSDSDHWSLGRWLREERKALPESLAVALQRRLSDLGEKAVEPLEAAAVLGRSFDFTLWREVSGLTENDLFEIADKAVKREILAEAGAEQLLFSHDLLRRQLLQGMTGMKRRRIHGKAAQALIARPDAKNRNGGLIARHAVEAGMKREAAAFGLPAVDALANAGEYEQAWVLLEGIGALFTAAEPMAPEDDIEWRGLRGDLLNRRGHSAEASAILEQTRERLRELPAGGTRDQQEMKLLKGLAEIYYRQGRYDQRVVICRQGLALSRVLGDAADQAGALISVGQALIYTGDLVKAEEHLTHAEPLLPGVTDEAARLRLEGRIAHVRSIIALFDGRVAVAAQWAAKGQAAAQATNDKAKNAINSSNLGEASLLMGRLAEAKRWLGNARKLIDEIGDLGALTDNLNTLGLCTFHEDRLDEAETLLQQSLRPAEEANRALVAFARIYLAQVRAAKGDLPGARELLGQAFATAEAIHDPALQAKVWATRAAIDLHGGNPAAARSAADRALEISAGRYAGDDALAGAVTAAARLRGDAGDPKHPTLSSGEFSGLETQFRRSIESAVQLENVPLEFELRLIAAESLFATGHSTAALDLLADTPTRAGTAGFARFAGRADKILHITSTTRAPA